MVVFFTCLLASISWGYKLDPNRLPSITLRLEPPHDPYPNLWAALGAVYEPFKNYAWTQSMSLDTMYASQAESLGVHASVQNFGSFLQQEPTVKIDRGSQRTEVVVVDVLPMNASVIASCRDSLTSRIRDVKSFIEASMKDFAQVVSHCDQQFRSKGSSASSKLTGGKTKSSFMEEQSEWSSHRQPYTEDLSNEGASLLEVSDAYTQLDRTMGITQILNLLVGVDPGLPYPRPETLLEAHLNKVEDIGLFFATEFLRRTRSLVLKYLEINQVVSPVSNSPEMPPSTQIYSVVKSVPASFVQTGPPIPIAIGQRLRQKALGMFGSYRVRVEPPKYDDLDVKSAVAVITKAHQQSWQGAMKVFATEMKHLWTDYVELFKV